jgi:hypothetical protein
LYFYQLQIDNQELFFLCFKLQSFAVQFYNRQSDDFEKIIHVPCTPAAAAKDEIQQVEIYCITFLEPP